MPKSDEFAAQAQRMRELMAESAGLEKRLEEIHAEIDGTTANPKEIIAGAEVVQGDGPNPSETAS